MAVQEVTVESLVAAMLTENTGSHFLDSGGAYGRSWQRHQTNMKASHLTAQEYLAAEPFVSWSDSGDYITVSTYHHLTDALTVNEASLALDAEFHAFAKDSHDSWMCDMESFIQDLIDDGRVDRFSVFWVEYTYNTCEPVSQDFQYASFEIDEDRYFILHTHNGCDARGGFSTPHVFAEADSDYSPWLVGSPGQGVDIYCSNDDCRISEDDGGNVHAWKWEGDTFRSWHEDEELDLNKLALVITSEGFRPSCPHCGSALDIEINRC